MALLLPVTAREQLKVKRHGQISSHLPLYCYCKAYSSCLSGRTRGTPVCPQDPPHILNAAMMGDTMAAFCLFQHSSLARNTSHHNRQFFKFTSPVSSSFVTLLIPVFRQAVLTYYCPLSQNVSLSQYLQMLVSLLHPSLSSSSRRGHYLSSTSPGFYARPSPKRAV